MAIVEIEIRGLQQLRATLRQAEQAVAGERALDIIGAILLDRTRKRFLDQVDPDGIPWEPSLAARGRAGAGGTLFDTGSLFASIDLFRKGPGQRTIAVSDGAVNRDTGESVAAYALIHQEGLEGQPQRQFLGFGIDDAKAVEAALVAILRRTIG